MDSKPNILLIVIDCLRADRTIGADVTAHVPTIAGQLQQGTAFPNCISINSMTTPCMTSMFSGLYPHTHGVRALSYARVADDIPLLAEILKENGYRTIGAATGPTGPYTHLDRGFIDYEHRDGVAQSFLGQWGDKFIAQIRSESTSQPWFAYLHLWEVHMPRQVADQYKDPEFGRTNYDRAISTIDARLGDLLEPDLENTLVIITGDHGEKVADSGLESSMERVKAPITDALRRSLGKRGRTVYGALIGIMRQTWFALARTLYRQGLLDDPLGTITGHGFHIYDSLVKVPLIISGYVDGSSGQTIDDQARQIDIMPTILDLVGLGEAIPTDLDGRSLRPLIDGEALPSLPVVIETCQNPSEPSDLYGVRTPDWKFARNVSDPSIPDELYDLNSDPKETTNLADSHPDVIATMAAILEEHLSKPRRASVALSEEMSKDEMGELAKHLEKLGYLE